MNHSVIVITFILARSDPTKRRTLDPKNVYLAPEKKSLDEVSRVPLTAPKVEQATKIGMNQDQLPYMRLAKVTATASDLVEINFDVNWM